MAVNDISGGIVSIVSEYTRELEGSLLRELSQIGDETAAELEKTSPEDTGEYKKGWRKILVNKPGRQIKVVVANRKPHIVHLLEYGTQNHDGTQRTKAQPHVAPANDNAQKKLTDFLEG